MSIYKRNVENLDPKRGDKLTLKRETIVPLCVPSFPRETRRDILDTIVCWFADEQGKPTPHLKDPLADAFAQSIISGQIAAVQKYIDKCDQAKENRTGKTKPKGNTRQPSSTKVNGGVQYNDNDNDNGNDNINHCQVSLSGEGSPQVVVSPAAPPPSIEDARQWLDEYAPPCCSNEHLYDAEHNQAKGMFGTRCIKASNATEAAEVIDEYLTHASCKFLPKLKEAIVKGEGTIKIGNEELTHDEIYKRVMLHAYCENVPEDDDAEGQQNTSMRIFQAVKKCHQMIDAIAGSSGNAASGEDY